jgi:hypothetical protein
MTISPAELAAYGQDWPDFSFEIVWERARGRCECRGQCAGPAGHLDSADGRCRNRHGQRRWRGAWWQRAVILSVAHRNHDPECRDPEQVFAACESCHLRHDALEHWQTRRRRHEEQLGLLPLFELA